MIDMNDTIMKKVKNEKFETFVSDMLQLTYDMRLAIQLKFKNIANYSDDEIAGLDSDLWPAFGSGERMKTNIDSYELSINDDNEIVINTYFDELLDE